MLGRGTLFISLLNFVEMARTRGGTATNIPAFLDRVGVRWSALTLSPRMVVSREKQYRLDPWRDEIYLPHLLRAPGVHGKPGNLARRIQQPKIRNQIVAEWEKIAAGLAADFLEARRRNRTGDLTLDGFWDIPPELGTSTIFATTLQRLVRSSLKLERHQIDDLLHTCIPVAFCDVVFLDRKTKNLLKGMQTHAKVFYAGELEEALSYLERLWPSMATQ